jgi:CheY-like chemotaxis protein
VDDRQESCEEERESPLQGREHVLLVDDEKGILEIHRRILHSYGYQVTTCLNCAEAMTVLQSGKEMIDLVLTDMAMPEMDGYTFALKLVERWPHLPVILCTGFSEFIDEDKALESGIRAFLLKPIRSEQLAKTIRRVLG